MNSIKLILTSIALACSCSSFSLRELLVDGIPFPRQQRHRNQPTPAAHWAPAQNVPNQPLPNQERQDLQAHIQQQAALINVLNQRLLAQEAQIRQQATR